VPKTSVEKSLTKCSVMHGVTLIDHECDGQTLRGTDGQTATVLARTATMRRAINRKRNSDFFCEVTDYSRLYWWRPKQAAGES